MPYYRKIKELAKIISEHYLQPEEVIETEIAPPPCSSFGHISMGAFKISKILKNEPNKIAHEIETITNSFDIKALAEGPYVNWRFPIHEFATLTLNEIFSKKERYGSEEPNKKNIVIEYCSPNIAKPLAFQHIRSTLIGNSLANIFKFLGFNIVRINFIGDWGSQFSKLIAAVKLWGDEFNLLKKIESFSDSQLTEIMNNLFELYVRFHDNLEKDDFYIELGNKALKELESYEEPIINIWKKLREISIIAMNRTLKRLNVEFDLVEGESDYIRNINNTIEEIKLKAQARFSEGTYVVDVPQISVPALIQKSDGSTLYLTRDIAAAIDRYNRFKFDKMVYVVSDQQNLHFQLLFGVLKKMGHSWSELCEHTSFGTVLFGSEKMSTRAGKVVFLDDLLNEAEKLALSQCKKNTELKSKDEVAKKIAAGAIIFGELSAHRQREIRFDWKNILSLDGETGPYVQYTYVRCNSLIEKAIEKGINCDSIPVPSSYTYVNEEETLVIELSKFRYALNKAAIEKEPFRLTKYLIDLSSAFNRFYYNLPVLQANSHEKLNFRINLVKATKQVIENGLKLLGIECPTEM